MRRYTDVLEVRNEMPLALDNLARLGHMANGLLKVSFFPARAGCALNNVPRQEYSLREILRNRASGSR